MIGIGIAIGLAAGVGLALLAVSVFGTTGVSKARRIREQLIEDAQREAEAVRREAQVEAREQAVRLRSEIDSELTDRRAQVLKIEERVLAKELEVERKLEELARRDQGLADREENVRTLQEELKEAKRSQLTELEQRLAQARHSDSARDEAVGALERAGVLDDARLAENRAELLARRGYGDAAIRADLSRRLIPAEEAAVAVAALEPEPDRIRRVLDGRDVTPTLLRRLAGRGFSRDMLGEIAAEFAQEA